MKIDLHCHTKSVKDGEAKTRNVTSDLFRKKIEDADIKIVAITNHNCFDIEQYCTLRKAVQHTCDVWPGIEIDVKGQACDKWHLVIVCNPKFVDDFHSSVEELTSGTDIKTTDYNIDTIIQLFDNLPIFYIPHYYKAPAIAEKDLESLLEKVNDIVKVIREPSNSRTLGVLLNHGQPVLIGSDVQDWNIYETYNCSELRLPVSSFEQFDLLVRRDRNVVTSLLDQKKKYTVKASPHASVQFNIEIYNDVNVVFGQKGTGKSKILESIEKELVKRGLQTRAYYGSEKYQQFSELTKTDSTMRTLERIEALSCEENFHYLQNWKEANPSLLSDYIDWANTRGNNTNKERMKITNSSRLPPESDASYVTVTEDGRNVQSIEKAISKINIKEYLPDSYNTLTELIRELKRNIRIKQINEFISIEATRLTNYTLEKLKSIADKKSNTKSKPLSTGFDQFAANRIDLYNCCSRVLENIEAKPFVEQSPIGELEEKGLLYVQSKYRMLCDDSLSPEFELGIRELRKAVEKLQLTKTLAFTTKLPDSLKEVQNICGDKINSTLCFLGVSKCIVTEDGNSYSPSEGEKGIILLQRTLNNPADAYIIDEPELGMGNSYIEKTIRPKISDLASSGKVVLLATHNANIAVRTLPYVSVFRTHSNGIYKTYVGNPFIDTLTNIDNPKDNLNWREESLHTLEGGEDAFYGRGRVYAKNSSNAPGV